MSIHLAGCVRARNEGYYEDAFVIIGRRLSVAALQVKGTSTRPVCMSIVTKVFL
ncbi:MAG: hypothetical protein JXN61_16735 [Sedimentisphaerales bacterium]|nr:hypothetical protein [Sedimentisphaerales bacterium]